MLRIRTAEAYPPKQVGLVRACVHVVAAVECFADLDAALDQFFAGGLKVGNDQIQTLRGTRCRRGNVLTENYRTTRAGRRELDHAEITPVVVVCVEPPTELRVELFRAVDIRDRNNNDLELHVDRRGTRCFSCWLCLRHVDLLPRGRLRANLEGLIRN